MNLYFASVLAALGLGFGLTAFTTLSVRSENSRRLVSFTFIWSTLVLFGLFLWAKIPPVEILFLGLTGLGVGIMCVIILKIALYFERKSDRLS